MVETPPANEGDVVRSLGGVSPLEKEIANRSSILAWKIPWTEERRRLQSRGSQSVGHDFVTKQQHSALM